MWLYEREYSSDVPKDDGSGELKVAIWIPLKKID